MDGVSCGISGGIGSFVEMLKHFQFRPHRVDIRNTILHAREQLQPHLDEGWRRWRLREGWGGWDRRVSEAKAGELGGCGDGKKFDGWVGVCCGRSGGIGSFIEIGEGRKGG